MDIRAWLRIAAQQGASDLHMVNGMVPMLRIDGVLKPAPSGPSVNSEMEISAVYSLDENGEFIASGSAPTAQTGQAPLSAVDLKAAAESLLTPMQYERLVKDQDIDLATEVDNVRYRINISYERGSLKIVARVVPSLIPTLAQVGMPPVIYDLLGLNQGLILLTGPTGCGKSTSMAAMLNYINLTRNANIITFEDPIEFLFESKKCLFSQRQLGIDVPSFESGLKHVLRQDPNVIMVGEMRDLETVAATITLAETGHLVLATLHTSSAAQTIDRIIDIFPSHQQNQIKTQLSSILQAVISQKLLPKIGGGRVAAREIMLRTSAIANLIREDKVAQINNAIETGAADGMINLNRSLKDLYEKNLITAETAKEHFNEGILS
jgi:twitching motility protein PilT